MAVRATLELGDPLLRQPAQVIDDATSAETQRMLLDLQNTLADLQQRFPWCHALAAPMIGHHVRMIALAYQNNQWTLINPRFESWGRSQVAAFESCIAFNMLWGEVYRPDQVVVVAQDGAGDEQRFEVDGQLARIIQHEMDHLDGLVWLDRDPDLASMCTTNEYMRMTIVVPD